MSATIVVETSRALPLVSFTVATFTGAAEDAIEAQGRTRLLARLMRRTGGGRVPHEMDALVDGLGASLASDVSASATGLHGTVISRSVEACIDVVLDVLARPGLADAELERLKRETLADLVEARDDDRTLARRWFRRTVFAGHPYGQSISGNGETLSSIDCDALRARHREVYAAGNLCFAFSGDIDAGRATAIAERIASALPGGARRADPTPDPAPRPGRHLVFVDKPERTQTQILIGGLGTHARDADHVALHVANTVFGGTFSARLTREVRSKRGWSYGAYSSLPIDRRRQAFSMWTFPKASDAAACIALELGLLAEWIDQGITQAELDQAKSYLVKSHAFAIDTPQKRVGQRLDEVLYDLPPGFHGAYLDRVRAVTLDEANAAVRARIPSRDLIVTVVGTEADVGGAVRDAIPGLTSSEVVPFDRD